MIGPIRVEIVICQNSISEAIPNKLIYWSIALETPSWVKSAVGNATSPLLQMMPLNEVYVRDSRE